MRASRRSSVRPWAWLAVAACLGAAWSSAGAAASKAPALEDLRWNEVGTTLVGIADRGQRKASLRAFDGASGKEIWRLPLDRLRDPKLGKGFRFDSWQPSTVTGQILLEAHGDLFLAEAQPPSLRRLTATPDAETDAALSPDGSRVAFVRAGDLWTIEIAGGRELRLTDDGRPPALVNGARPQPDRALFADGSGFAWAPESRTIAFVRRRGERSELATVTVLVPAPQTMETGGLADGELTEAHWRFDARALVVERRGVADDRFELLLCHPEKRYCRPLARRATQLAAPRRHDFRFLPDGFLWTSSGSPDALARFDSLGRERHSLERGDWRFERIEAQDAVAGFILVSASRATPNGAQERALLRLSIAAGAPRVLASGAALEFLVSPSASRFLLTTSAPDGALRRELRDADGKLIATLAPAK